MPRVARCMKVFICGREKVVAAVVVVVPETARPAVAAVVERVIWP